MSGFFEELKRRKVYRVAVAYIIAAGGIIQLASAVFPAWELPNWALRLVVILLLLGFPLSLVLAWAFDVTPQGIQTTPRATATAGARHRRRNVVLLILAGVVIAAAAGFFLLPRLSASKMDKSIAVLPFQNFSDNPQNVYFADGIQDDLLTCLAKIGDLKVISRTSVMGYRGTSQNVREIGKALGVSFVLEGSVRREKKADGERVRVNVQLIDTATDRHIWAEDYDRELTDVFAIQSDLAQKIAHELQAQLSPTEKAQMMQRPTDNGEAYLAFVEAHNLTLERESLPKLRQAVQLYERALQLDPKFALAAANLSILHSWIFHSFNPTDAEREAAERYAQEALALRPDMPEAHLAQGFSLYYGKRDFKGALEQFATAQRGLPNDAQIYLLIGAIQRRQGDWKASTANLEKAVSLNPKDPWPLQNLAFNYQMVRDYAAANRTVDRGLALDPKSAGLLGLKASLAIEERGDVSAAEKALARLENDNAGADLDKTIDAAFGRANLLLMRQKYAEALASVQSIKLGEIADPTPNLLLQHGLIEGIALEKLGRAEEARNAFARAKAAGEAALRVAPNDPNRHGNLARVLAHLGEKEAAISEAKRAVELLPVSEDAFEGPGMLHTLADVYAIVGENQKAIAAFDDLLSRPSDVTSASLRIDPEISQLLKDPEFQKLLAKHDGGR